MGYDVSSIELGKSFPCYYARCIPHDFIPGLNLPAGSSFSGQIFLVLGINNFLDLLCNFSSLCRFMHCLVRTSHRDSDLITHFLISQIWTTLRSARVTLITAVLAFAFVSWWLAEHWEAILLGIPGQTGYLRALFSKGSFSNKLSYLHPWTCVGEVQLIPEMPSRSFSYWFCVKYLALWQHQISSATLFSFALMLTVSLCSQKCRFVLPFYLCFSQ